MNDEVASLLGALASAKSEEAQAAVASIVGQPDLDVDTRIRAANQLALIDTPTEQTLLELERAAGADTDPDLRESATLALGGAARRAGARDETREAAARAVRVLLSKSGPAQSTEQRLLQIQALGNSGSAGGFETIKTALADSNASLRAAAVYALRFIPLPEADALIASTLRSDPDGAVRLNASRAARYRSATPELVEAIAQAIRSDRDAGVRTDVIDLARGYVHTNAVRESLQWASQNDPVEDLRTAALDVLATSGAATESGPNVGPG